MGSPPSNRDEKATPLGVIPHSHGVWGGRCSERRETVVSIADTPEMPFTYLWSRG